MVHTYFFFFSSALEREKFSCFKIFIYYYFLFGFNKASIVCCCVCHSFGGSHKKGAPLIFMTSIGSFSFLFHPRLTVLRLFSFVFLVLYLVVFIIMIPPPRRDLCSSDGLIYLLIYKTASPRIGAPFFGEGEEGRRRVAKHNGGREEARWPRGLYNFRIFARCGSLTKDSCFFIFFYFLFYAQIWRNFLKILLLLLFLSSADVSFFWEGGRFIRFPIGWWERKRNLPATPDLCVVIHIPC